MSLKAAEAVQKSFCVLFLLPCLCFFVGLCAPSSHARPRILALDLIDVLKVFDRSTDTGTCGRFGLRCHNYLH